MTSDQDPHSIADNIAASVRDQLADEDGSRRQFLTRTGIAGGALLALGGGTGLAFANEHEEDSEGMQMGEQAFDDVTGTDLDVLRYALTLERLEDAFYQEAMMTVDEQAFTESEELSAYGDEQTSAVYADIEAAAEHEATHVEVLTQAVELLGGEIPEEATYDFGIESASDVIATGQVLENTGVAAYAGAAPYIESPDLLNVALSIHSVEARHAALLNQIAGESVAPNAFDPAASQQEVLDAASQFTSDGTVPGGNESEGGNETETPPGEDGNESEGGGETETPTPTEDEGG